MSFGEFLTMLIGVAILGYSTAFGLATHVPGVFGEILATVSIVVAGSALTVAMVLIHEN